MLTLASRAIQNLISLIDSIITSVIFTLLHQSNSQQRNVQIKAMFFRQDGETQANFS
jgi:hypothetical protein